MKKFFSTLLLCMVAVWASAQTVVPVELALPETSPAAEGTVIADNDYFTATTVYSANTGKSSYKYPGIETTFTNWVELRVDKDPTAENPAGTQKSGQTSVKLDVKKATKITAYVRTGNNKTCNLFKDGAKIDGTNTYTPEGAEGEGNYRWAFSWDVQPGTYYLTERGGTGRLSGFSYIEAAAPAPAPVSYNGFLTVKCPGLVAGSEGVDPAGVLTANQGATIQITMTGDAVCDFLLPNFALGEGSDAMPLGDILVPNVAVSDVEGGKKYTGSVAGLQLLGGALEADVNVDGTIMDDGTIAMDIAVTWMGTPIAVTFTSAPVYAANELAWSADAAEVTLGEALVAPTLANPHFLAVTFASSDPAVATVAEDGTVTVVAAGTTTITATAAQQSCYLEGAVSYALTVKEAAVVPPVEDNAANFVFSELFPNEDTNLFTGNKTDGWTCIEPLVVEPISMDFTKLNASSVSNFKAGEGLRFYKGDVMNLSAPAGYKIVKVEALYSDGATKDNQKGNFVYYNPESTATQAENNAEGVVTEITEGEGADAKKVGSTWSVAEEYASNKVSLTNDAQMRIKSVKVTYVPGEAPVAQPEVALVSETEVSGENLGEIVVACAGEGFTVNSDVNNPTMVALKNLSTEETFEAPAYSSREMGDNNAYIDASLVVASGAYEVAVPEGLFKNEAGVLSKAATFTVNFTAAAASLKPILVSPAEGPVSGEDMGTIIIDFENKDCMPNDEVSLVMKNEAGKEVPVSFTYADPMNWESIAVAINAEAVNETGKWTLEIPAGFYSDWMSVNSEAVSFTWDFTLVEGPGKKYPGYLGLETVYSDGSKEKMGANTPVSMRVTPVEGEEGKVTIELNGFQLYMQDINISFPATETAIEGGKSYTGSAEGLAFPMGMTGNVAVENGTIMDDGTILMPFKVDAFGEGFELHYIATFTNEPVYEDPGLAWSAETFEVTMGQEEVEYPTLTNPYYFYIEYSSSNPEVATVDDYGEITLVAPGTTVITAKSEGNEQFTDGEASYTLVVKGEGGETQYGQTTIWRVQDFVSEHSIGNKKQFAAPTTFIDNEALTVMTPYAGTYAKDSHVYPDGTELTHRVTVQVTEAPSVENPAGVEKTNNASLVFTPKKNVKVGIYYRNEFNGDGDRTAENMGKTVLCYSQTDNAAVEGTNLFAENAQMGAQYLYAIMYYELEAGKVYTIYEQAATGCVNGISYAAELGAGEVVKAEAGLSFDPASITAVLGEDLSEKVTFVNPNSLAVTFTNAYPEVATVDETGKITVVGVGTTTIKATSEENDQYYAGEAEITVTVNRAEDVANLWKVSDLGSKVSVEADQELWKTNDIEMKAAYATTTSKNAQTIDGMSFTERMLVRVETAPTAEEPNGTVNGTNTALVVTPKADMNLTFYYRNHANKDDAGNYFRNAENAGKLPQLFNQTDAAAVEGQNVFTPGSNMNEEYLYATMTYAVEKGKSYLFYITGETMPLYGASYVVTGEPAPVEKTATVYVKCAYGAPGVYAWQMNGEEKVDLSAPAAPAGYPESVVVGTVATEQVEYEGTQFWAVPVTYTAESFSIMLNNGNADFNVHTAAIEGITGDVYYEYDFSDTYKVWEKPAFVVTYEISPAEGAEVESLDKFVVTFTGATEVKALRMNMSTFDEGYDVEGDFMSANLLDVEAYESTPVKGCTIEGNVATLTFNGTPDVPTIPGEGEETPVVYAEGETGDAPASKEYELCIWAGAFQVNGVVWPESDLTLKYYLKQSGIENVMTDGLDPNGPMFNIYGQRVSKNYRGVVIQNGRKFINK